MQAEERRQKVCQKVNEFHNLLQIRSSCTLLADELSEVQSRQWGRYAEGSLWRSAAVNLHDQQVVAASERQRLRGKESLASYFDPKRFG